MGLYLEFFTFISIEIRNCFIIFYTFSCQHYKHCTSRYVYHIYTSIKKTWLCIQPIHNNTTFMFPIQIPAIPSYFLMRFLQSCFAPSEIFMNNTPHIISVILLTFYWIGDGNYSSWKSMNYNFSHLLQLEINWCILFGTCGLNIWLAFGHNL